MTKRMSAGYLICLVLLVGSLGLLMFVAGIGFPGVE